MNTIEDWLTNVPFLLFVTVPVLLVVTSLAFRNHLRRRLRDMGFDAGPEEDDRTR